MASTYWRTGHTVASVIPQAHQGWDFLQLVRLLVKLHKSADGCAEETLLKQLSDTIHFKGSLASDFPPGEVRKVDYGEASKTALTTTNGSLVATYGPLPEPFIDWLRQLEERGDHAMADFLNMFGNRLQALRYVIARATRPGLLDSPVLDSDTGRLLRALTGNDPDVASPQDWDPSWDLGAAGLFANQRMSLPVVRYLLKFSLGLNLLALKSLQGGWMRIDKQDHTLLGQPQAAALGHGASLGTRVWDQHQTIELVIGPVSWYSLRALIPGGSKHKQLQAVIYRITDRCCDCRVTFIWPRNQVPKPKLGQGRKLGNGVLTLGYTATLAGRQRSEKSARKPLRVSFLIKTMEQDNDSP